MRLSFRRQITRFVDKVWARERALFENVDEHVGRSIRTGSHVTAAPGQPVDKGDLLRSWKSDRSDPHRTLHYSDLFYAPIIEDNLRGATLRSRVGGFHSVKMTRHGFHAIVRYELNRLNQGTRDPSGRLRDVRGRFLPER